MTPADPDDRTGAFLQQAAGVHYRLVLVVSGTTPNSRRAIANARALCNEHLAGRHTLTIVDLYQQPDFARQEQIVAVPTLIRQAPPPVMRFVGDLSSLGELQLPADREH